jgi:hypothetical protein
MRALAVAAVLLASPWALAQSNAPVKVTVRVGESALLHLASPVSVGACDDTSIVRVEDAGEALKLVGLKAGHTQCGFWRTATPGQRTMVDVEVTPETAKH